MRSSTEDKHRVQLDFAPQAYARLTKIVEDGKFASKEDAIQTSLAVLEWYLAVKSKNSQVLVRCEYRGKAYLEAAKDLDSLFPHLSWK